MRVLARRQQAAAGGSAAGTAGDSGVWSDDAEGPDFSGHEFGRSGPSPATRRRRVLVGLLAVSSVLAGLAAAELLPWWTWYVSLIVAGGFVGLSAWIASGERSLAATRVERFRAYRDQLGYAESGAKPGQWSDASVASDRSVAAAEVPHAPTGAAGTAGAAGSTASAGSAAGWTGEAEPVVAVLPDDFGKAPQVREDGTWDPVEVPLPTYVTKDAAPRTGRRIQIGDAPEHRSLLDESGSSEPATTGIRDELYDRELTGDFDDLRAVND